MLGARGYVFELDLALSEGSLVAVEVTTPDGARIHMWSEVTLNGRVAILAQLAIYGVTIETGQLGWPASAGNGSCGHGGL